MQAFGIMLSCGIEMTPYSIYLHIPFCRSRCHYCDFNTYSGIEKVIPEYVQALLTEIKEVSRSCTSRLPVHSVYFGGGTPTLIPVKFYEQIIGALNAGFEFTGDLEMTMEANPGTVLIEQLRQLFSLGVNRLSYGMQSAKPDDLTKLGRAHSVIDLYEAVQWSRRAGFNNLSLDLIYGFPWQSLESWQQSLKAAVELHPEHLSLYSLIVEPDTPLNAWIERGLMREPDDDLAADMYEWAMRWLPGQGFEQYEISNWGRRSNDGSLLSSRHNLQYWRNGPYLGFGAGAHGSLLNEDHGTRLANIRDIHSYISACQQNAVKNPLVGPAVEEITPIDRQIAMQETMIVGLRLTQGGVSQKAFFNRFGIDFTEIFASQIDRLNSQGLTEWCEKGGDTCLRLTLRGRMIGNQVFMQFLGE
jgi:oxygen-independent coproporphyrinogen-3 oxidase